MKNDQKYKTAEERVKAFNSFCDRHYDGGQEPCAKCPLFMGGRHKEPGECEFRWLSLEADDGEKIESCPFCGADCRVESDAFLANVTCSDNSCLYNSGLFRTREEAISAHNRVARAVREKEREVK